MSRSNQEIAAAAAAHSYGKHGAEFTNPKLGGKTGNTVNVRSQADLSAHVQRVLSDPTTRTFEGPKAQPQRAAQFHYHRGTNTMLTVPNNPGQAPTVYRPPEHAAKFMQKARDTARIDGAKPKIQRSVEASRAAKRTQEASRETSERQAGSARTTAARSTPSRGDTRSATPSRGRGR